MGKIEVGSEKYFDKLLNIDCTKEFGWSKVQEYLFSVPQIKKVYINYCADEICEISLDILEKYLHQISIRKGYQVINIQPFYGKGHKEFVFYTCSVKRVDDNIWIGNVYGKSVYEAIAKLIILINKDIKYPREKDGGYQYE